MTEQQQPEKLGFVGGLIVFAVIVGLGIWMYSCMSSLGEVEDCTGKAQAQDTYECLKARDLTSDGKHNRLYVEAVTAANAGVFDCPQIGPAKIEWRNGPSDTHYNGRLKFRCGESDWFKAYAEVSIKDGSIQNLRIEKGPFK